MTSASGMLEKFPTRPPGAGYSHPNHSSSGITTDSLKSAIVGGLTPCRLANAVNQRFSVSESQFTIHPWLVLVKGGRLAKHRN